MHFFMMYAMFFSQRCCPSPLLILEEINKNLRIGQEGEHQGYGKQTPLGPVRLAERHHHGRQAQLDEQHFGL